MTTLYVGIRKEATLRLVVAQRRAGSIWYELCWEGKAENVEEQAFAMIAQHLDDGDCAQSMSANFARLISARPNADFWTLRPSEIDEAIASQR